MRSEKPDLKEHVKSGEIHYVSSGWDAGCNPSNMPISPVPCIPLPLHRCMGESSNDKIFTLLCSVNHQLNYYYYYYYYIYICMYIIEINWVIHWINLLALLRSASLCFASSPSTCAAAASIAALAASMASWQNLGPTLVPQRTCHLAMFSDV